MFSGKLLQFSALTGREIHKTFAKRCFSGSAARQSARIGFIGLGNMGAHMAANLIKGGHDVLVYDVMQDHVKRVVDIGGHAGGSPADVAEQCDTVVTMLPASPQVKQVFTGENGILGKVHAASVLIDSSTIDPSVSQEMEKLCMLKGATYLDAPVSGGVLAARDAGLTFMVGGTDLGFAHAEPILKLMGKNVVHTGRCGTGQAAKICNNMLLGISMIGTSEAMNLGMQLGLDAELLARILNMSSGRCWSSEVYNPVPGVVPGVPSSNNYQGGFGTALMTKDLGLAQNAATQQGTPTPMGSLAHQLYRIMTQSGYGGNDFSVAFKFLHDQQKKH